MQAVRVYGLGDIRIDEVREPGSPGPAEILVAPAWCGLCGTDLKEYAGPGGSVPDQPHPLTGACKPLILGHEFSASVVAAGSAISSVAPGDRVAVMPLRYCGRCPFCLRGEFILCPNKAWLGLSDVWGGLGDLALVHSYQVTPLGSLTAEQGAVVEPAAVSLNAVLRAGVTSGDTVLVVGSGPIGALAVLAAFTAGASAVYVSEPNPKRAAMALTLGAAASLEGDRAKQVEQIRDLTRGMGVDVAIDCAGKEGTVNLCIETVRPGGVVSVPSVHRGPMDIDIRSVTRKPVSIIGSLGYTKAAWDRTVALIGAGKYPVERVVTSRVPRDEIIKGGFDALVDAGRGEVKILVEVGAPRSGAPRR
ncbi:MAG: zinc-binding dehydrogenase [Candidatus Rokuibacteriota bacterium]|nr:MAG: zinc-binding dehydrogenase [Candidatus Rokubacteria bacterium]